MASRIVQNIRRLLDEKGWSPRRLACNMGMPKKRLMRVLNEKEVPDDDKVRRIAEAFGVNRLSLFKPQNKEKKTYRIDTSGSLTWSSTDD